MAQVDNKIVSITFDNVAFQKNLATTLASLDKLRGSLNFDGAKKSLSDLSAAGKDFKMEGMSTSVDGLNAKFLALSTVGITALASITSKAIDAGLQFGKAFSFGPISQGFEEFELKMGSIQTIMAGSGASMEEVNNKLLELNNYADRTIYSFKDMTSNIGKFTNAGVSLDDAVGAIQGVANVAALAGANAEEASRGMYNFAQALSTGSVKLIDWKSIELANMGTVEFKQQIIDTALALGTLTKSAGGTIKTLEGTTVTTSNFQTTLADAWFTADVLTGTLNKFSDETTDIGKRAAAAATDVKTFSQMMDTMKESIGSGWFQSFEAVLGNFEEGKHLWSAIMAVFENVVGVSAEARNKVLEGWKEFGGRNELVAGFFRILLAIRHVMTPIKEAFRDIFPKKSAKDLFNITKSFADFTDKLRIGTKTAERVKNTFRGIFAILGVGWAIVKGVARVFFALVGAAVKIIAPFLAISSGAGALTAGIHNLIVEGGALQKFFDLLVKGIGLFGTVVGGAIGFVIDFVEELVIFTLIGKGIGLAVEWLGRGASAIKDFVAGLGLFDKAAGGASAVADWLNKIALAVKDFVAGLGLMDKASDAFDSIVSWLGQTALAVQAFVAGLGLFEKASDGFDSIVSWLGQAALAIEDFVVGLDLFGKGSSGFSSIVSVLQDAGVALKDFVDELGIFGAISVVLGSAISALGRAGTAIKDFFTSLSFGGKGKSTEGTKEAAEGMKDTASAAELLLKVLKTVVGAVGNILSGLGALIGGAFKGIGTALGAAFSSDNTKNVLNILQAGLFAGVLLAIRNFFKNFSFLNFLDSGLGDKIGKILDRVQGALKALQTNIKADTLRKIAIAMLILAASIIALSFVDGDKIMKSMAAMAVGFGMLVVVMKALDKISSGPGGAGKLLMMAGAMVLMAAAMAILVIPIFLLGKMDYDTIEQGLATVAGAMIAMGAAIGLMGSDKSGLAGAGLAMIFLSVSLLLLYVAVKKFADMDPEKLAWGMAAAALGIAGLVTALRLMPNDMEKKGLGMLILTYAMKKLSDVVILFASMSIHELVWGFGAIAGGLTLIGLAMKLMPNDSEKKALGILAVSVSMFILAEAIKKLSAIPFGDLIKGLGALLIMLGALTFAILVMDGAQGGVKGLLAAAVALFIFGHVIEQLGKMDWQQLLTGLLAIAGLFVILGVASVLAPGIALLGVAMLALGAGFALAGLGAAAIGYGLLQMATHGTAAMGVLVDGMQALIRELPGFIVAFIQGILDGFVELGKRVPELIGVVVGILLGLLEAIITIAPQLGETLLVLIETGLTIFIESIPMFVEAGMALITGFLTGIADNIEEITILVADIVIGFIDALTEKIPEFTVAIINFIETALISAAFGLGELAPTLMFGVATAFMEGFWNGLTEQAGYLGEVITGIINDVIGFFMDLLGIESPSKVLKDIGINVIKGLINGIKSLFGALKTVFIDIPVKILIWLGDTLKWLANKGKDIIIGLKNGIGQKIADVRTWFFGLKDKILGWLGDGLNWLLEVGKDLIRGLWNGINEMKDWVMDKVEGFAGSIVDGITGFFGIGSPSKVFQDIGISLGTGLAIGIADSSNLATKEATDMGKSIQKGWAKASTELSMSMANIDEFNPTITPILDLSLVQSGAKGLSGMLGNKAFDANLSVQAANDISRATLVSNDEPEALTSTGPTEIKFEQNIYAPKELSTNDIYRNTKGQIALAKEELNIS